MNDKTSNKVEIMPEDNAPLQNAPLQKEVDELKREMRSAKWQDLIQSHQQKIIGAVVALVIVLMASGLWIERDRAQNESAATLYQQAVNEKSATNKLALLESVSKQFSDSSYAALAMMQLARVDQTNAAVHLNDLIHHHGAMQEWVWQARLDLAQLKLSQGDSAAAKVLLQDVVGKQYQQLRYYLLATLSQDAAEKTTFLQKAFDAKSNDDVLKQKIKSLLPQQAG